MDGPVISFKKRAPKGVLRKAAPPPRSDSGSSSGSELECDDGCMVKRRKTHNSVLKASTADQKTKSSYEGTTKYDADRSAKIEASNDATKQSNWYDDDGKDALSSKNLLGTTRSKPESFIKKNLDAPNRQVGPVKAPTNIRTITITDYSPDVCKDYKQTGFCGFGDSCKFLHAREDYAAGWKLDREWELSGKGKRQGGTIVASANRNQEKDEDGINTAMLEKIPFACIICKKPYTGPIITKCGHYFCEACALKRYRKDPSCAACGVNTSGVFNNAKNLQKLLDKKRKWEEKKKEQAKEEGEGERDDDGPSKS
ncbi:hypothetical protein K469DRAFT_639101 [Zopfia rhizophila CBS 207.26]|uniref:Pre-mRNA-splicing factor CWC24 n=1 Tax=Zopfia rhizophila CBS 207.26 TaxID=1314779 RepID=A0A6A6DP31_9PEZI|nr:hypothetical protein K469DRAFT_639101 [Zopfia rhizophila CBS 207.26]